MQAVRINKTCEACGESAIPHGLTYLTIVIDGILGPLTISHRAPGPTARTISRVLRYIMPKLFRLLVALRLARKVSVPDTYTSLLGRVIWEEAKARGIDMWEFRLFGLARNLFYASLPDDREIAFEGMPLPPSEINRVPWMDEKARLKAEFQKRGLPVARGKAFFSLARAKAFFRTLGTLAITKPNSGSGSRHTTLHINDEVALETAFRLAKQIAPIIVVEEELVGPVHRITVVNGVYVAALRRYWPRVIGDGVQTVGALVARENENPKRSGPYFSVITRTRAVDEALLRQNLTWDSVPEKETDVRLHQKMNWVVGGTTEDVTHIVHSDNKALFEQAARELYAPIAGIDFIIEDISRSWKEQSQCGILECNSMPFIEVHHVPFKGSPQNVAGAVWDMTTTLGN